MPDHAQLETPAVLRAVSGGLVIIMLCALTACQTPASLPVQGSKAERQVPSPTDNLHVFADGARYEGGWKDGRMHGFGTFDNGAGLTYTGGWQNGKRHGEGTEIRPDGSRYDGSWVAGKRSGSGRESSPDGSYHDGEWELNQPRGPGLRREATGIEINGTFAGDIVTSGMISFPSGAFYAGPMFTTDGHMHQKMQAWLEDSAARGDPWSQAYLARLTLKHGNDRSLPIRQYLEAADRAGLVEASYLLGLDLRETAPEVAETLLLKASRAGYPGAMKAWADQQLRTCTASGHVCVDDWLAAQREAAAAGDHAAGTVAARVQLERNSPAQARELIRNFAISFGDWRDLDLLAQAEARLGNPAIASRHMQDALAGARRDDSVATEEDIARMQAFIDRGGLGDTTDETTEEDAQ